MLQFPINWTTRIGVRVKELHLSTQWQIIVLADECVVEIRRNDASDEVHISGTLTLTLYNVKGTPGTPRKDYKKESKQAISRFMKPGSSFEKINFDDLPPLQPKYSLNGLINIFNITQYCTAERKKCVHMKSLVELSNELQGLLDPQNCWFTDVKLKCGSESIPAHKNILSARSSIFAAMFKNAMRESQQNEVDIIDMDVSVLRVMLTYIYSGKTPDLTVSLAADLLFAADKYQLQDLKRVCCDFLQDNFSLENVLRVLVLGDLHSENELRCNAISYICNKCKKFSDLEETEDWRTMLKERPTLAMEILTTVLKSRDVK